MEVEEDKVEVIINYLMAKAERRSAILYASIYNFFPEGTENKSSGKHLKKPAGR